MNNFLKIMLVALLLQTSVSFAIENDNLITDENFPKNPVLEVTPGKLCSSPDAKRYPEQIAYCNRNVDPSLKDQVIKMYDQKFGFKIEHMSREDFKIDHLIPLCAGGDNDSKNLWPQHKSIYLVTDPLEPAICTAMAQGKLLQADAIKLVIAAKTKLEKIPVIMKYLGSLYTKKALKNPLE